ncbi:MAG: hypothetical protein V3U57_10195 [Robiginitomaculum sp.]
MILKTGIFALLTMVFAGGAVYYGSDLLEANGPSKLEHAKVQKGEVMIAPRANVPETVTPNTQARTQELQPKAEPQPMPEHIEHIQDEPAIEAIEPKKYNPEDVILLVLNQTENIKAVELKDQAYLNVVNYAVRHNRINVAETAMRKINQVELRDTARSQIAITLAKQGRAEEAFEFIDAVEIDALRDVMRLQVIEAMIIPQRLPKSMQ